MINRKCYTSNSIQFSSSDANEFPPSVSKRLETFGESKFEDSITIVDDGSPTIESYNNSETKVSADNVSEITVSSVLWS